MRTVGNEAQAPVVVNCSFDIHRSRQKDLIPLFTQALDALDGQRVIIVCSAGNDGMNIDSDEFIRPRAYPKTIVVGGITNIDTKCADSNFGQRASMSLDIFAVPR